MDTIGIRLETAIKKLKITKKEFANSIDYSPGNVTDWIKGRYKPSAKALINMENVYNLSQKWLIYGEGDIFIIKNTSPSNNDELTKDEFNLLNDYRNLDDYQRGKVRGYIDGLVDKSVCK
ncbi:helix-turn-helix domain-containing protein [Vallitalea guaymasensis]|uniref:helix-turn-helix domain-containing protein n=1 Tax=Vallitalea guaymasensis TaxID=1185412 RepID=UPI000DE2D1B5|nr:helix-turn-helix transcriptional regulator [Vallitalea guaymasensis]